MIVINVYYKSPIFATTYSFSKLLLDVRWSSTVGVEKYLKQFQHMMFNQLKVVWQTAVRLR